MKFIVSAHDSLGFYGPFDDEHEADKFAFAHNGRVVALMSPLPLSSSAYICQHCGVASPKGEWGPGHVRCPRCNKVALSAAESMVEVVADAIVEPEVKGKLSEDSKAMKVGDRG